MCVQVHTCVDVEVRVNLEYNYSTTIFFNLLA